MMTDETKPVRACSASPAEAHGDALALAHRIAWRYKKSSDPAHSDTYTFNEATLLQFVAAVQAAHVQPKGTEDQAAHDNAIYERGRQDGIRQAQEVAPAQPSIQELAAGAHYPQVTAWEHPAPHAAQPIAPSPCVTFAVGAAPYPAVVAGDAIHSHYFKFERGERVQKPGELAKFWPASGLVYYDGLSLEQRTALDELIRAFLDAATKQREAGHASQPPVQPMGDANG